MKLAILSDTHIGDPASTLVKYVRGKAVCQPNMDHLIEALGTDNDYLILLGDIMEFSITDYYETYTCSSSFFGKLRDAGVAKEFIYVPGNHDYNIWDSIEQQANVINQIRKGKSVRKYRHSVPFIVDDRPEKKECGSMLAGVKPSIGPHPYGGMFLDHMIPDNIHGTDNYVPFIVAYPNVYLLTEQNEVALLTHGHYLESFWSATSTVYRAVKELDKNYSMKDFVAVNFPLCQLSATGLGQSGPLTVTARKIQKDVKDGFFDDIRRYVHNIVKAIILVNIKLGRRIVGKVTDVLIFLFVRRMKRLRHSDYITDIINNSKDHTERFDNFFNASVMELKKLKKEYKQLHEINTQPDIFIFGHTHVPAPATDPKQYRYHKKPVKLINTGGWLETSASSCGGAVVHYETGKGFTSKVIDVKDVCCKGKINEYTF